jgi:hypothetical protein
MNLQQNSVGLDGMEWNGKQARLSILGPRRPSWASGLSKGVV